MPQAARGLFGGQRRPSVRDGIGLMERLSMAARASQGGPGLYDQMRSRQAAMQAEREAEQTRFMEDRIRAQLSPADGPAGSGTGAMPTIEQQTATLDEAQLLNPAVAAQFAPIVRDRQRRERSQGLFGNDPLAQMLFEGGNEAFLNSLGKQYGPMTAAEGTAIYTPGTGDTFFNERRSVVGDRIVGMGTNNQPPRELLEVSPSFKDRTERAVAERPQAVNTPTGAITSLIGLDGGIRGQIEGRAAPVPRNPADDEDYAAAEGFRAANERLAQQLRNVAGVPATDDSPAIPPLFDLTPTNAIGYRAALATGIGMTPEAAAYGDYVSEINGYVSEALRLNVGPQTDQDAIREARALLSNIDNRDYVTRRLPTVMANNDRLRAGREQQIDRRRGGQQQAPQGQQAPARPSSRAEFDALPSGALFMAPDGTTRRKP